MEIIITILSTIFWFIIILIPLVAIHEFGHLLMSKLVGVKVVEYGIGIPPRAIARRWKGMIWSLNWLPLGGFAKIYGDHDAVDAAEDEAVRDEQKARRVYQEHRIGEILASGDLRYFLEDNNLEYDDDWKAFEKLKGTITEDNTHAQELYNQLTTLVDWEYDSVINSKQAFINVSWWRQTIILLGGITFNLITAVVIFFFLFSFISTPPAPVLPETLNEIRDEVTITSQSEYVKVLQVIPDTAADRSGIEPGDDFISFAGTNLNDISSFEEFAELVKNQPSREVTVVYRDDDTGEIIDKVVELDERDGQYFFGLDSRHIGYLVRFRTNSITDGISRAFSTTGQIFLLNFQVLGDVVRALLPSAENRDAINQVGGPVAIGSVGSFIFDLQGPAGILNVIAAVSISLAAFNLLPIPALDGGRFVIVTLNAVLKKRNKRVEAIVISATFVLMLLLAAAIAVNDVVRIISGNGFGL